VIANNTEMKVNAPVAFVVFGVTGDLTRRKLIPAVYELKLAGRLEVPLHIIGFARRDWSDDFLRETLREGVKEFARSQPVDEAVLDDVLSRAHYVRSTFDDVEGYHRLSELLAELGIVNVMFYLATPPESYVEIIRNIGATHCEHGCDGWTRLVVEKPYGEDLTSAIALDEEVHKVFREDQVYRIDHYLGKETVQNILVFRFANGIFEPLWNRNYVDFVQITVAETIGVGTRAGYYETAGVVKDIFQNHMLQLVALTAMEAPVTFNADAVRDEKVKVLKALRPLQGREAILNTYRAQYTSGTDGGQRVPGYKDENGVSPNSITETYLAARLNIDNWRWAGVPFYMRAGKRLPTRVTEIAIQFKQPPLSLFNWQNMAGNAPNVLILTLQPNEGITLTFGAKSPRPTNEIAPVKMDFSYEEAFGTEPPEAYERLLLDVMMGDATLFTRSDEVKSAWAFTTQILEAWQHYPVRNLPVYEAGTSGPPGADDFIGRDRWSWRNLA
jgi:glucose-6-phosphate 1-dehydrogenase